MDSRIVKAKNNESGTLGATLSVAEVGSATVSPVPTHAPGVIVFDPGTTDEEHVFFAKRDAGAGTISGLIRDYTNLNGGVGIEHGNGASWETQQASEYLNNIVDAIQSGWVQEPQAVAKVDGDTFTVEGNQTAIYTAGKFVRYNQDDTKIGVVLSSSYSAGTGLTTVEVKGFTVPVLTHVETPLFQTLGFSGPMPVFYGEDEGSNDTYAITVKPNFGAYFVGMTIMFKANTANTGAATLNVNALGAITIKKLRDQDLSTGDIEASQWVIVVYDGTNFQMMSQISQVPIPTINEVEVTAAPGSDLGSAGLKTTLTAGEDLVFGDVTYVKSDGKMGKADADAIATSSAIAFCLATIANDASGAFLLHGFVRNDGWNWTVGGLIYLSTTAGGMTQTAPSGTDDVIQILGVATHADRMYFNPQLVQVEHT